MRTLCIDIGGSGIKALAVNERGEPVTEKRRIETPDPATPEAVLDVIRTLSDGVDYDRVSVGFPGVVEDGITRTAHNLGEWWVGYPLGQTLEELLEKPVRVANDAGIQGLAVIEGKGTEVVITLGTGMGFGLYIDGRYVPNIEMAHHPFRKGRTYEERVSDAELERIGVERWLRRVDKVIAQLAPIFNFRKLYVGGGNARHLDPNALPDNVTVVDNVAGMLGGVRLWDTTPPAHKAARKGARKDAAKPGVDGAARKR